MKISTLHKVFTVAVIAFVFSEQVYSQACTTLGQTPSTAFPVCGTTSFPANICAYLRKADFVVHVPCRMMGLPMRIKILIYYKFTCFQAAH